MSRMKRFEKYKYKKKNKWIEKQTENPFSFIYCMDSSRVYTTVNKIRQQIFIGNTCIIFDIFVLCDSQDDNNDDDEDTK